ncbi:MAG: triphosphoribosyl-dephospho-CoA synthase, partial [Bacteroidales bacterium]|nr:triphosphoribosyl-dephospho-CoA synthase [Bacteroidales bacterium]
HYNELMKEILPAYGIRVVEIPRLNVENERPGIAVSASTVRKALDGGSFKTAASLTPPSTWPYLVAELSARALLMELDASLKPGLVDPTSNGAHSDMDYDLMLGSIKVIRRSFTKHLVEVLSSCAPESVGNQKDDIIINRSRIQAGEVLSNWGKAIERDVLEYTEGINTHRGAIFSLGITSAAALALCGEMQLSDNKQDTSSVGHENATHESSDILIFNNLHFTTQDLSEEISRLAEGLEQGPSSHGGRIVNEYGVKGALQMAREGYRPLFEDWLPFYRGLASTDMWRLQKTLLRIMSRLDDTCVIHRVGFDRAQEVRKEAQALLEDFSPEELKQMKERYDSEGISPGGAADMLALTILADSLLN